ncbi:hypothetical protein [Pedobacter sp. Leaf132]|uniref:hypothetical protein n=1 Tax=Pedobacter sp. Leaf132 TaxID=2876557 RepID=UPI001E399587|nr:hypothetical protein [Pedobacter sp. Leaf132]
MPRRKKHEVELNGIAKKLGAEIYAESPGFVCLLPADVHNSVTAKGGSVAEAVENWDSKLQAHLRNAGNDDPVVIYVKKMLALANTPTRSSERKHWTEKPQHVIDFENQFYVSRKR